MHPIRNIVFLAILLNISLAAFAQSSSNQINVTDTKDMKQGAWQKLDARGRIVYKGQFKDNIPFGVFTYYYEDGKVRTLITYSEDGTSSSSVSYHPNGKKMAEGGYIKTKKSGTWKYYNDLESLSAEEFYKNGLPVDTWKTYYDEGKLLEECPYENGLKEGTCRQYFSDSSLKSEVRFRKGKCEGPAFFNYPNGKTMLTGQFRYDKREGLWKAYKDTGEPENEIEYLKGEVIKETFFDKARENELKNEVKEIPE